MSEVEAGDILDHLQSAARPLILAGPAISRGRNWQAVRALQSATGVPALPCESPRGVDDPWLRGTQLDCLAGADLVLLLGKRLDHSLRFGDPPAFSESVRFLAVDAEDPLNPSRLDGCFLGRSRRGRGRPHRAPRRSGSGRTTRGDGRFGRRAPSRSEWRAHRDSDVLTDPPAGAV